MGVTRRLFLKTAVAFAAAAAFPSVAFAKAKKVAIGLAKIEKLRELGGWAVVEVKDETILFVRDGEDHVSAVSGFCSHEKCPLAYAPEAGEVVCSCHGSRFSVEGKVLNGPAEVDLHNFNARLKEDKVIFELEEE